MSENNREAVIIACYFAGCHSEADVYSVQGSFNLTLKHECWYLLHASLSRIMGIHGFHTRYGRSSATCCC